MSLILLLALSLSSLYLLDKLTGSFPLILIHFFFFLDSRFPALPDS